MDEDPAERAADLEAAPPRPPVAVPLDGPEAEALAAEAEEIRQLVESGASSPEDLKLLAARIREHRAREEAMWRAQVKPQLVKARKGSLSLGRSREAVPPDATDRTPAQRSLLAGGAILAGVLVIVLLAASTSILLLLIPVVGLLVYAWSQGCRSGSESQHPR